MSNLKTVKLHRPIVLGLKNLLEKVFIHGHQLDVSQEMAFRQNPQWGSRDRKFIASSIYFAVRNWGQILSKQNKSWPCELSDNDLWYSLALILLGQNLELPSWPEFHELKLPKESTPLDVNSLDHFPDWALKRFEKEHGPRSLSLLKAQWREAPVYLRFSLSKNSAIQILQQNQIEFSDIKELPQGLCLLKRSDVKRALELLGPKTQIQDGASQMISPLLMSSPTKCESSSPLILDACAGAGGKSLHLLDLIQKRPYKEKLLAFDINTKKLHELKKRAHKAKSFFDILEEKSLTHLTGKIDRLLLDAPCSGLGVLRRHPDTIWHLTEHKINETIKIQRQILNDYSPLVKKGGFLVYATCSILPSENEEQVQWFLKNNENFILTQEHHFYPDENDFDGMYAALIQKT